MSNLREFFDETFNLLLGVHQYLPEDWRIILDLSSVEVTLCLYNPDDVDVEFHQDDRNFAGRLFSAVNTAREQEGLEPVRWTEWFPKFAYERENPPAPHGLEA